MSNDTATTTQIIPIYHDWTVEDVWKLFKEHLYEVDGEMKMRPIEREPDGMPKGYTAILTVRGKHYRHIGDDSCDCDHSKSVCKHWREIR